MGKGMTIYLPNLEDFDLDESIKRLTLNTGSLLFSGRQTLDILFQDYCRETKVSYGVTNFLAWLEKVAEPKIREAVLEALSSSLHGDS